MDLISLYTHPITLFILQQIVIVLFAGFTVHNSYLRFSFGLPLVAALAWIITTTVEQRVFLINVRGFLSLQSTTQVLHYVDVLLVGKWDYATGGPRRIIWHTCTKGPSKDDRNEIVKNRRLTASSAFPESRLHFGLRALVDNRGANQPWESKGTPHFSSNDPNWIPSRARFLTTRLLKIVAFYLFLDLLTANPPEDAAAIASPDKIDLFTRWQEVAWEELAIRLVSTTITWAAVISLINMVYDIMSFLAVALHVSEPRDWRPMINSPLEAYTVRRFWSPFYHQFLRRRLASIAGVITDDVLGLPRGAFASRYLSLFLIFFTSGLVHLPGDTGPGLPLRDSRVMTFFMAQFVAICFEDLSGWITGLDGRRPAWWLKAAGNVWVVVFMGLMVPYWLWPINALPLAPGQNGLLPFSIIKMLTSP